MAQWNVNALEAPRVFYLREQSTLADVGEQISRLAADEFRAGKMPPCPADYEVSNCSQRVVRLIFGTAKLAHRWQGIEPILQS